MKTFQNINLGKCHNFEMCSVHGISWNWVCVNFKFYLCSIFILFGWFNGQWTFGMRFSIAMADECPFYIQYVLNVKILDILKYDLFSKCHRILVLEMCPIHGIIWNWECVNFKSLFGSIFILFGWIRGQWKFVVVAVDGRAAILHSNVF